MSKNIWDTVASEVDFNLRIDVDELKRRIPLDYPILEYGCGYGRICNLLRCSGFTEVAGCDNSLAMITRGKQGYPDLKLFRNSKLKLEIPDSSFEAIIFCALLTCVPNNAKKSHIVTEAYRLLRSDGVFHVAEFCSPEEKTFESELGVRMHYQRPDQLRALLNGVSTELKFEVVKEKTMSGKNVEAISYFGRKDR